MKGKKSRIFGVLMALVLALTLAGVGAPAPASADPGVLDWSEVIIPGVGAPTENQLAPDTSLGPIAVSPDGRTLLAAVVDETAVPPPSAWYLYRSTDGGYTWREMTGFTLAMAATGDTSPIVAIEVSPLWADDDIMVVATEAYVYMSGDKGQPFDALAIVPGTVPEGVDDDLITSLDVALDKDEDLVILVGTKDLDDDDWGGVFLATEPTWNWVDQQVGNVVYDTKYDVLAVAFSPSYATDKQIVAVVTDDVGYVDPGGVDDDGDGFVDEDPINGIDDDVDGLVDEDPAVGDFVWNGLETRFTTKHGATGWGSVIVDAVFLDKDDHTFPSEHACIAFPDDYKANPDLGAFYPFVGLSAYAEGKNPDTMIMDIGMGPMPVAFPAYAPLGDVYRVETMLGLFSSAVDLNVRGAADTAANIWSLALSGDWEDCIIIVGSDGINYWEPAQLTVHTSGDGGTNWLPSMKFPTGIDFVMDYMAPVVGMSANCHANVLMAPDFAESYVAYAGTIGFDSGFSVTISGGSSWNQRGLIDAQIVDIYDLTPSPDYATDSTLYMVTGGPTGGIMALMMPDWSSLWKATDVSATGRATWERVCTSVFTIDMATMSMLTFDTLVVLPDGVVFITELWTTTIARSTDAAATFTKRIPTVAAISAWYPVDMSTIIIGDPNGDLWRTTDAGATWTDPGELDETSEIPDVVAVYWIAAGPEYPADETILVGDDDGNVYLSIDDGITFERVGLTGPGVGGEWMNVAFDPDYAVNEIVYAAGDWGSGVQRWNPEDELWEQVLSSPSPQPIYIYWKGLVAAEDGALYACAEWDSSPGVDGVWGTVDDVWLTGVWRTVDPTTSLEWAGPTWESMGGWALPAWVWNLSVVPGSNTLFAIDAVAPGVWIFTDTLVGPVSLVSPVNESSAGTIVEGTAMARVVLSWEAVPGATEYEYEVALDAGFLSKVEVAPGVTTGTATGTVVDVDLWPNTTYYWRVRVSAPLYSPQSEIWSFTTVLGPAAARPSLLSPTSGTTGECASDVSLQPVFQWSGLVDATAYELQVATSYDFSTGVVIDKTGAAALGPETAFPCDVTLAYDTDYFWRVRALSGVNVSPWSDTGCFSTMEEPVPAAAEPIPGWVWALIAIGVIFAAAVIVLIMRTRRPV